MTLDKLLEYTEKIKNEIIELNFHPDDVRLSFFGLYFSSIYEYYTGKAFYRLAEISGSGDLLLSENAFFFKDHFHQLTGIQSTKVQNIGYHNNLSRNLIFGVWTSFELAISMFFDNLVSKKEKQGIIDDINSKLFKAIKKLEDEEQSEIKEFINKSTFIPIIRKFNFLVKKKPKCYSGDLKHDREFLNFAIKLRNCIVHANGIYYGNDYNYMFKEVSFTFRNKEVFVQQGPNNQDVYLQIVIHLKTIFKNLMNCLNDIKFMEYPDDGENIQDK